MGWAGTGEDRDLGKSKDKDKDKNKEDELDVTGDQKIRTIGYILKFSIA